ncbi:MAG: cytochrome c biogenesis protein ResB [bacterium]
MARNNKNTALWSNGLWGWLFSLKVGIVVLTVLAVASIYGTLINPLERAQQIVYYSWWYKLLLLILASNVSCTTIRTIIEKVLPLRHPRFVRVAAFYKSTEPNTVVLFRGSTQDVASAFKSQGFKVAAEGPHGHARKGQLSRWGAPLSHTGLIVLLIGGFASEWVAREGWLKVAEGEATDVMYMGGSPVVSTPLGFTVVCDDFDTAFFPKTRMPSRFVSTITILKDGLPVQSGAVEVNNSLLVNGWKLHQTSYEELEGRMRYRLAVHHPDVGTTAVVELSQGQQRTIAELGNTAVALQSGLPLRWALQRPGEEMQRGTLGPQGDSMRLVVERFEPDFVMGADRRVASRSDELKNPAALVSLYSGAQQISQQWLFGREDMKPMSHSKGGPFELELESVSRESGSIHLHVAARNADTGEQVGVFHLSVGDEVEIGAAGLNSAGTQESSSSVGGWTLKLVERVPAYATQLTMTRNPMIPVIYLGCTIMFLGLMIAFFIQRKEVWFWVEDAKGRLHIAASYRHPRSSLDRATEKALAQLAEAKTATRSAS